jgi:hypothetical protein
MAGKDSAIESGNITKEDLRAKLEQIRNEADRAGEAAKPTAMVVAAAAVVAVAALAYLMGRRRGRKNRTVVEVRRV